MSFKFRSLMIPQVIIINTLKMEDRRGFFSETYRMSQFGEYGINEHFTQDNYVYSVLNTLRGLHFQCPPHSQGKLLTILDGVIFDVAVDLRKESSTYGQWVGATLSPQQDQIIYIPPGFAHGLCVLSTKAIFVYKTTTEYVSSHAYGIRWNDPTIGIKWPVKQPILSDRDSQLPLFTDLM